MADLESSATVATQPGPCGRSMNTSPGVSPWITWRGCRTGSSEFLRNEAKNESNQSISTTCKIAFPPHPTSSLRYPAAVGHIPSRREMGTPSRLRRFCETKPRIDQTKPYQQLEEKSECRNYEARAAPPPPRDGLGRVVGPFNAGQGRQPLDHPRPAYPSASPNSAVVRSVTKLIAVRSQHYE